MKIYTTTDHNWDIDQEYKRILKNNGRVERLGGIGPLRVWLKNEKRPGLAMTRSIGDDIAKTIGVISTPEITIHTFEGARPTLIIGSDGLFEFLENQLVVRKYQTLRDKEDKPTAQEICKSLVETSLSKWEEKEDYIDDITWLVVNFSGMI